MGETPVAPAPAAAAPSIDVANASQEPAEYVLSATLTANQELLDQALQIAGDSDFVWLGTKGVKTGEFEIRFKLPSGRYLSSARVRGANAVGTAQFPVPVVPGIRFAGGSNLGYDIKDLSGAPNDVQIVLIGMKLFRTA
jgi:hypothetical protein